MEVRGMSSDTRLMCGISLILVPTIIYGGLTVLGIVSGGRYGAPAPPDLSPLQVTLYRAMHAHAGVLILLALFLEIALDHVSLPAAAIWPLRLAATAVPLLVAGGFFGLAHFPALRVLLYLGAFLLAVTTVSVGVGLIRGRP
jgi:hypothetical protein